jgi:hypothetical protein
LLDGTFYKGSFDMGFKEGHGELHFIDGAVYRGQFSNDLYNGHVFLNFLTHL